MARGNHGRITLLTVATLQAAAILLAGCNKEDAKRPAPSAGGGTSGRLTIAVIPKGTTHVFWRSVQAGAEKAGSELDVNIIWKGPLKEDDKTQQIGLVDGFVADGVSGICLAPLDSKALLAPAQSAADKKIPVVIFDSALEGQAGKDFASFVATDNKKGGQMAGAELARLLGGKGKVVMLRYKEGHASTGSREDGFMEEIHKHPDLQVIQDNRYGGATAGEAQTAANNLLDKLKETDGVFCPNESSTQGMLSCLEENGLAGKVKFVGFDTSRPLVDALQKGEIQALVAQDPQKMGYEAVQTIVKVIHGKKVPDYIDTGAQLVTKENVDTPAIKTLIGG